jgi:hypothetical protein
MLVKEERWPEVTRRIRVSGITPLEHLSITSDCKNFGYRYEAVNRSAFKAALGLLNVSPSDFTFIDLGSGKGFALILAADSGFKRLIGIEFAPLLAEESRRNLHRALTAMRGNAVPTWDVLDLDVTKLTVPEGNNIFFMCNPFNETVVRDTFARVKAALTPNDKTFVVYVNATHRDVLEDLGFNLVAFAPVDPLRVYKNGIAVYRA